jgi:hypothetical protein
MTGCYDWSKAAGGSAVVARVAALWMKDSEFVHEAFRLIRLPFPRVYLDYIDWRNVMSNTRAVYTGVLSAFTLLAALTAASAPALADCSTGDCWGAVAYGASDAWAWSVNHRSRGIAERAALSRCGGRCGRVLTFHNTCGAYVVGPSGYGWATSRNRDTAVGAATRQCNGVSRNCQLRVWACTS